MNVFFVNSYKLKKQRKKIILLILMLFLVLSGFSYINYFNKKAPFDYLKLVGIMSNVNPPNYVVNPFFAVTELQKYKDTINVNSLGIYGDGKTDVTLKINNAIRVASSKEAVLYFPSGRYLVSNYGVIISGSNFGILGSTDGSTVFVPSTATTYSLMCNTNKTINIQNVLISHIAFTCMSGSAKSTFALLFSGNTNNLLIDKCIFNNVAKSYIYFDGVSQTTVSNSKFYNTGDLKEGYYIYVPNASNLRIINNFFTGYYQCLYVAPRLEQKVDFVLVENNYFDGMWYLTHSNFVDNSNTLRFLPNGLIDNNLNFDPMLKGFSNKPEDIAKWKLVRVDFMRLKGNAHLSGNLFTDNSASFITSGVVPGEIIESGGLTGIIDSIVSDKILKIEFWYFKNGSDRRVLPSKDMSYILKGIYLGRVKGFTTHSIQIDYWHDLNGKTVIPSNNSKAELISLVPLYAVHFTENTSNATIINNRILRNYADQIGFYGSNSVIKNNYIKDGQDVGITITNRSKKGSIIENNYIRRQGTCGIYVEGNGSTISDNIINGPLFTTYNLKSLAPGSIILKSGNNNSIMKNNINVKGTYQPAFGVSVYKNTEKSNNIKFNNVKNSANGDNINIFNK